MLELEGNGRGSLVWSSVAGTQINIQFGSALIEKRVFVLVIDERQKEQSYIILKIEGQKQGNWMQCRCYAHDEIYFVGTKQDSIP